MPALVATLPGAALASSSLLGFSNYGSRHLFGEDLLGVAKGSRGQLSPLVWFVLFRCLPSLTNSLVHDCVHQHAVKPEVFLVASLALWASFATPVAVRLVPAVPLLSLTPLISLSHHPEQRVASGGPQEPRGLAHTALAPRRLPVLHVGFLAGTAQLVPWCFSGWCGSGTQEEPKGAAAPRASSSFAP